MAWCRVCYLCCGRWFCSATWFAMFLVVCSERGYEVDLCCVVCRYSLRLELSACDPGR